MESFEQGVLQWRHRSARNLLLQKSNFSAAERRNALVGDVKSVHCFQSPTQEGLRGSKGVSTPVSMCVSHIAYTILRVRWLSLWLHACMRECFHVRVRCKKCLCNVSVSTLDLFWTCSKDVLDQRCCRQGVACQIFDTTICLRRSANIHSCGHSLIHTHKYTQTTYIRASVRENTIVHTYR